MKKEIETYSKETYLASDIEVMIIEMEQSILSRESGNEPNTLPVP